MKETVNGMMGIKAMRTNNIDGKIVTKIWINTSKSKEWILYREYVEE